MGFDHDTICAVVFVVPSAITYIWQSIHRTGRCGRAFGLNFLTNFISCSENADKCCREIGKRNTHSEITRLNSNLRTVNLLWLCGTSNLDMIFLSLYTVMCLIIISSRPSVPHVRE